MVTAPLARARAGGVSDHRRHEHRLPRASEIMAATAWRACACADHQGAGHRLTAAARWVAPGVAAETGLLMASPSETTLILLGAAAAVGTIDPRTAAFWQTVTALGLTLTPLLAKVGRWVARRVDRGAAEVPSEVDVGRADDHLRLRPRRADGRRHADASTKGPISRSKATSTRCSRRARRAMRCCSATSRAASWSSG